MAYMETYESGQGCETREEFDPYQGELLTRLKDFKGVVKCFGTDPLCQFFNTLKFTVKVGLAQLELKGT
jgi:hypothetical protein